MYVLVTAAFLLLYFSLGRPQLGSTTAITADGSCVPTEQLLKAAKFVLAIARRLPQLCHDHVPSGDPKLPAALPFHVSFTTGMDNDS
ncbi:unnamed protein product [Musa hybrid cultivar]